MSQLLPIPANFILFLCLRLFIYLLFPSYCLSKVSDLNLFLTRVFLWLIRIYLFQKYWLHLDYSFLSTVIFQQYHDANWTLENNSNIPPIILLLHHFLPRHFHHFPLNSPLCLLLPHSPNRSKHLIYSY